MVAKELDAISAHDTIPSSEVVVLDTNTLRRPTSGNRSRSIAASSVHVPLFHLEGVKGLQGRRLNHRPHGHRSSRRAGKLSALSTATISRAQLAHVRHRLFPESESEALVKAPQEGYRERRERLQEHGREICGFSASAGRAPRRTTQYQHGTMTMMRKNAMIDVGGWAMGITEGHELASAAIRRRLGNRHIDPVWSRADARQALAPTGAAQSRVVWRDADLQAFTPRPS